MICLLCECRFEPAQKTQRYCCADHRKRHYNQQRTERASRLSMCPVLAGRLAELLDAEERGVPAPSITRELLAR